MLNVRFGSLADISERVRHVRFTPLSGHPERQASTSAKCLSLKEGEQRPAKGLLPSTQQPMARRIISATGTGEG